MNKPEKTTASSDVDSTVAWRDRFLAAPEGPKTPPLASISTFLVLGPVLLTILSSYDSAHPAPMLGPGFHVLLIGFAAMVALTGTFYLTSASRAFPLNVGLSRFAYLSTVAMVVPMAVLLSTMLFVYADMVVSGLMLGTWLAFVWSAYVASRWFFEHREQLLIRTGVQPAPAEVTEIALFRRHLTAAFALAGLTALLITAAVQFLSESGDRLVSETTVLLSTVFFIGALGAIAWWTNNRNARRSVLLGLALTVLLALPLHRLAPEGILRTWIIPLPGLGALIPLAIAIPACIALVYWWMREPVDSLPEGFISGFFAAAIPSFTVGTAIAALLTYTPTAVTAIDAEVLRQKDVLRLVIDTFLTALVFTQLITLGPPVLFGLLGSLRANLRAENDPETLAARRARHPMPVALVAMVISGGLMWLFNTLWTSQFNIAIENAQQQLMGQLPFPAIIVQWLSILPSAALFLFAFASLMYRAFMADRSQYLMGPIILGLAAIAIPVIVYRMTPDFMPVLCIFGALMGLGYIVLVVYRRIQLGAPDFHYYNPSDFIAGALNFSLVAGAVTFFFSFFAPFLVLQFVTAIDIANQQVTGVALTYEQVVKPIGTLRDLWVPMLGMWGLCTTIWFILTMLVAVVLAILQFAGSLPGKLPFLLLVDPVPEHLIEEARKKEVEQAASGEVISS